MLHFSKLRGYQLRLLFIIFAVALPMVNVQSWAFAQNNPAPIWVVRSLHTKEFGANNPNGLAFSPAANAFFVLNDINITLVTMGEDNAGTLNLPEAQADALNTAFDKKSESLFVLNRGKSELVKIKTDWKGLPNASASPIRYSVQAFGIKDPQGITFDQANGLLFVLDANNSQIVSVAPHAILGFDANEAIKSNKVQKISLKKLRLGLLKGLAFNPSNGHLYATEPAQKKLYELTQDGTLVSTFDLASLGINNPLAMTFAPSGDTTDDPNIYNLFVLDNGQTGQAKKGLFSFTSTRKQTVSADSQVVELSLIAPTALPPGTTLLPTTLVHIIDTSIFNPCTSTSCSPNPRWNPSAPDAAGVDYWPMNNRLIVVDSEVEEMRNYYQGKNVYLSTTSGTLTGTCDTTAFSKEPTGVAINPNNNHIFISDDTGTNDKVFEVSLGPDGNYCTGDDMVTITNVGAIGASDAEDIAYGNNTVFISSGIDAEVFRIPLGANGILGGGDDGAVTHFDTAALGFHDLEGIGYNSDSGTLFIVSTQGTEQYLGETNESGTLLRAYNLSLMGSGGNKRSDVAYAPGSQNPAIKNIYIASRNVDNNNNSQENDGQVWEISIAGSGTSTPSRTPTRTNTPTVTPTRTNTPTQGPTSTPTRTFTPTPTFTATSTFTPGASPTSTRTPTSTSTAIATFTPTNTSGASDLIFADGFESGNLSAWTANSNDLGDLSVSSAAALVGSQGMQALIDDANTIYVTDDTPNAEPRYRARFYFDPNSISMASGNAHYIFKGFMGTSTSTEALRVEFRQSAGAYQIRAALMLDNGTTWVSTNWFTISDASHFVELDWRAATGVGANNGGLTLWIDGTQQADLTGADNDTWRVDRARIGALTGIDVGTSGTCYFDAFESRRQTYIGP